MRITLEIKNVDAWLLHSMMLTEQELCTAIRKELAQVHNTRKIEFIDRMKAKDVYPSIPYDHHWVVEL